MNGGSRSVCTGAHDLEWMDSQVTCRSGRPNGLRSAVCDHPEMGMTGTTGYPIVDGRVVPRAIDPIPARAVLLRTLGHPDRRTTPGRSTVIPTSGALHTPVRNCTHKGKRWP